MSTLRNQVFTLSLCIVVSLCRIPAASGATLWSTPVPLTEINLDNAEEWSPFLSFDERTLYFSRVRAPESYYGQIFQATRDEPWGPFGEVEPLPGMVNVSRTHILYPWVSPDNLRMYYYEQIGSRCRLMVSQRNSVDSAWPEGDPIAELNALGDFIMMPRLTADELTLVFCARDVVGGQGGYDLWMAERAARDLPFASILNIEAVNTESAELGPYISPDGLQLCFSSSRHGKKQLFLAKRASREEPFGSPVCLSSLDMPDGHNAQPFLSGDGLAVYFQLQTGEAQSTRDIYVAYAEPGYYVDAATGDDVSDGLGPQTAFASIQRAIDVAVDGDVVNVASGVYHEQLSFQGKAITVQGTGGTAVLEVPGGIAASFLAGEGPDTILRNLVIANSLVGVIALDCSPTLTNLTIVGNEFGIEAYRQSDPHISNCILWDNATSDLYGCVATYSCIERVAAGEGNFSDDPLFFEPANGEYHLQSERGRYWPEHDVWVLDYVTSPCIDAGDPNSDFTLERQPNGGRVNVGAYGGTPRASLSDKQLPGQATLPNPSDGETLVGLFPTLSWTPGADTTSHDVYFGSDWPPPFVGNQIENVFEPGALTQNTTYFWRIDERNDVGKTVGQEWSFTTPIAKGRACFVAATPVWVDGMLVPISQVGAGRSVCLASSAAGQGMQTELTVFGCVDRVQAHEGTFTCYDVTFETGNRLCVAENHYFQSDSSGLWVSLHALVPGMRLRTATGAVTVVSVTRRPTLYVGTVYNLVVPDSHQYLVGEDGVIARDY